MTPETAAHQTPPSLGFSRQEHWSGLPFLLHLSQVKTIIHLWSIKYSISKTSVQFSRSVMSDFFWPCELQHSRPPCPSPTPGVYTNPCPLNQWCHPTISSSVIPFSSCPQSFPASGSFPMSQLFAWGGQSIGASASASGLPMNTQDWSPSEWTSWISLQFQGALKSFLQHHSSKAFYMDNTNAEEKWMLDQREKRLGTGRWMRNPFL